MIPYEEVEDDKIVEVDDEPLVIPKVQFQKRGLSDVFLELMADAMKMSVEDVKKYFPNL